MEDIVSSFPWNLFTPHSIHLLHPLFLLHSIFPFLCSLWNWGKDGKHYVVLTTKPTWDTWQRRRTAPSSEPSTSSASSSQPRCPWWTALSPPCWGGTIIKVFTSSYQRRSNLVEKVLPEFVDSDERACASNSSAAVDQDCSKGIWRGLDFLYFVMIIKAFTNLFWEVVSFVD